MTAVTLFCLPCAGSSAVGYLRWRRLVPPWLRIEPVELPGRGSRLREPPLRSFPALARTLAGDIATAAAAPYALFGHSLGALLAYECAHLLRALGCPPPLALFAACCAAPTDQDGARFRRSWTDDALIGELRELGGTPAELFDEPELLRLTLDHLASDFAVCGDYRHEDGRAPLDFPIHVFGGVDDAVTPRSLSAWNTESVAAGTVTMMAGGHFFFQREPAPLLAQLRHRLAGHGHGRT